MKITEYLNDYKLISYTQPIIQNVSKIVQVIHSGFKKCFKTNTINNNTLNTSHNENIHHTQIISQIRQCILSTFAIPGRSM